MIVIALTGIAFFLPMMIILAVSMDIEVLTALVDGRIPPSSIILAALGLFITFLIGKLMTSLFYHSMITLAYEQLFGRGIQR